MEDVGAMPLFAIKLFGLTCLIPHRLSTVQNSDCIMVLENGRIIERGNHDELIAKKGRYYQLYTGNAIGEE